MIHIGKEKEETTKFLSCKIIQSMSDFMGDTDLQLGLGLGEHYYASPPRKVDDRFEEKPPLISFDLRFPADIFSRDNLANKASIVNEEGKTAMKIDDQNNGCRKKLKLTQNQTSTLECYFKSNSTLTQANKLELAGQLNLKPRQVEVWFQNRRARTKVKQTEEDHEVLKRCCENLRNENTKLRKELQDLRSHFPGYPSYNKSPSN